VLTHHPGTATGTTATHTYASAGEYEVNAQITLTGGSIVRAREDVHITGTGTGNPGPTSIDFTFSPSAPAVGQEIVFTASGASSGGTFNWKFPGDVRKSGNVVTFTFAAAGSYEVELELEHAGSETLHATHTVTVGGGGGPGPGQNVTSIDFAWSPQAPRAGQAVSFTASFDRQPPAGSVVKWRFPDNSRPEGTTATYTFAPAGTYTVRVQIEQPGQPSIEREKSVTIAP
jgi:PKD repeat protein